MLSILSYLMYKLITKQKSLSETRLSCARQRRDKSFRKRFTRKRYLQQPPLHHSPSAPQHSASAPPPQEANNPIEMIPRIESKYFMLYNKLRANAHV